MVTLESSNLCRLLMMLTMTYILMDILTLLMNSVSVKALTLLILTTLSPPTTATLT